MSIEKHFLFNTRSIKLSQKRRYDSNPGVCIQIGTKSSRKGMCFRKTNCISCPNQQRSIVVDHAFFTPQSCIRHVCWYVLLCFQCSEALSRCRLCAALWSSSHVHMLTGQPPGQEGISCLEGLARYVSFLQYAWMVHVPGLGEGFVLKICSLLCLIQLSQAAAVIRGQSSRLPETLLDPQIGTPNTYSLQRIVVLPR